MGKYLDSGTPPKLNQQVTKLKKLITNKENEVAMKTFQRKMKISRARRTQNRIL